VVGGNVVEAVSAWNASIPRSQMSAINTVDRRFGEMRNFGSISGASAKLSTSLIRLYAKTDRKSYPAAPSFT
jgi:hypothetical protein